MDATKVIEELSRKYPGRRIIKNNEEYPTEIICEIDPPGSHPEHSTAIAVIDKSIPHYHNKTIETYKLIKGELTLIVDGKENQLGPGDVYVVKPKEVHQAFGNESWVEVYSIPGWTEEDLILAGSV